MPIPEHKQWWTVSKGDHVYRIRYDADRPHYSPKWYVQSLRDLRVSKRWYSMSYGAFQALANNAIVWVD